MREFRGDWRDLFHTFRMALDPRKLSLAFAALWLVALGSGTILAIFAFSSDAAACRAGALAPDETFAARFTDGQWTLAAGRLTAFLSENLGGCCPCRAPSGAGFGFLAVSIVWGWFVAAAFGGAISRIAAVEIARSERMPLSEATGYAGANYKAFFWAPVSVVIGIGFFALCNVAAGALLRGIHFLFDNRLVDMNSGTLDALAHGAAWTGLVLGFPLALLSGFLVMLLAAGLLAGWPLMLPAMAAEGTDAFDAVSRSFSYVFARPWRYLAHHAVLLAYAVPATAIVLAGACAFTHIAVATGEAGMGEAFSGPGSTLRAALGTIGIGPGASLPADSLARVFGWILSAMTLAVFGLAASYLPAYLLTGWTVSYFLLRRSVDGTPMGEVWEEEAEDDPDAPPPAPAAS